MKQYTIRLLQPILDADERGRIALKAAAQLGGSAEKLEQLMAREAGSRIARAASAPHADRVATILRNAGLTVDVIAPDPTTEEGLDPGEIPVPPGRSLETVTVPLAPLLGRTGDYTPLPERRSNPEPDPFGLSQVSHPAVAPLEPHFEADPFAAPNSGVPFSEDPFAPPTVVMTGDPFAAPPTQTVAAQNANALPRGDSGLLEDPFAAFGSNSTTAVVADDLPPQARKARDRQAHRSSVSTQVLVGLIAPVLLVVVGTFAYLSYIVPVAAKRSLEQQASNTSHIFNSVIASTFNKLDDAGARTERLEDLFVMVMRVPRVNFAIVSPSGQPNETMSFGIDEIKLDQAFAARPQATTGEETAFDLNVDGQVYTVGISPINVTGAGTNAIGHLYVGLKNDGMALEISRTLVPIFIGLFIVLGLAVALASGMAAWLVRPIMAATEQATRISLGDLDRQIGSTSNDEIGDLLNSLERMRVSLKSMVSRLRRAQENP